MAKLKNLPVQEILNTAYIRIDSLRNGYDELSTIPHRHDHYELIWITDGVGEHYINFKPYPFVVNRIYMLQKGHVHLIPEFDRKGWVILIGEQFFQHFFALHPEEEGNGLFDPFNTVPYLDIPGNILESLQRSFAHLQYTLDEIEVNRDIVFHLFSAMLLRVNKAYALSVEKPTIVPRDRQLLLTFRKLLNQHYTQEHSVAFYTEKIGSNPKTINKICLKLTDRSVHELIEDKLLAETKLLLLTSSLNIKEISFQLGFNDPAYFGRFFKRHLGISPANYRLTYS